MRRRVVMTGMGWVTPLGHDTEAVWKRILAGESGVAPITIFDASTFPTTFAAEVKSFSLADSLGADAAKHRGASRNTQFALGAASAAWQQSGLAAYFGLDPTRVGVYLGGGEGPIDFEPFVTAALAGCLTEGGKVGPLDTVQWARAALQLLDGTKELEQEPHLAGAHLAVQFDAAGPNLNTLTACAASTQAIGEAAHLIRHDDADVMISGGTHSMIHPLGVTGFNRLTALSTRNEDCRTASRPFDRTRDGFVLGEGSGIVILEELEHARRRGAPVLAEVVGYGSTADAFRITDIHESGRGAIAAMQEALDSAGMTAADIDYISAHGTGTEENDKIESLAIRAVFGTGTTVSSDDPSSPNAAAAAASEFPSSASQGGTTATRATDRPRISVPISSVKSMIGHLIAAAGAVELITCVLAIRDGIIPPTINYRTPDPNCNLDYVPNEPRRLPVRAALSNSFGFGGQNDTLIIRAFRE